MKSEFIYMILRRILEDSIAARPLYHKHHLALAERFSTALHIYAEGNGDHSLSYPKCHSERSNLAVVDKELYSYDGKGVWGQIPQNVLRGYLASLDGLSYQTSKGDREINLSSQDIASIMRCFLDLEPLQKEPEFFEQASPVAWVGGKTFKLQEPGGSSESWSFVEIPHSADNRITARFDFADASGNPEDFLRFLRRSFSCDNLDDRNAKIRAIQEWMGLALFRMAHRVSDSRALFLSGAASSGKSILVETVQSLFPNSLVTSQAPHEWEMRGSSNSADFKMYTLSKSALNGCAELPEFDKWTSTDAFKKIISGDRLSVRGSGLNGATIRPASAHIFATNHSLTDLPDTTEGFMRRLLLVRYNQSVTGSAAASKTELLGRLRCPREQGRIFRWAAEGAVRVMNQRERYSELATSIGIIAAAREESKSPVDVFVQGVNGSAPVLQRKERGFVEWKFTVKIFRRVEELMEKEEMWKAPRVGGRRKVISGPQLKSLLVERGFDIRSATSEKDGQVRNRQYVYNVDVMNEVSVMEAFGYKSDSRVRSIA